MTPPTESIGKAGKSVGGLAAAALILVAALPWLNLGRRALWPPDEGRYAVVVREMARSGDMVVPTYGGVPRIDKPPLFMWAGTVSSWLLGGVSEAAVRLPSALMAFACLGATFAIGVRLFDRRTAVLATLVLGTSARFLLYSQWAATDMMLASFTTIAMAFAVMGRAAPASEEGPSVGGAGVFFMGACALAVLTKGPVGLVLPAAVLGADLLAASWRRPKEILRRGLRFAVPWAAGALVFLAITSPWFIFLRGRLGGTALHELLFHQNVDRFVDAWNAQQPWYFYFEVLPLDFMPWTLFLPLAFLGSGDAGTPRAAAWRFLRVWFLVIFVFFSAASGKSPEYLMPLLPAAALLVARGFTLTAEQIAAPAGGGRAAPAARRWVVGGGAVLAAGSLAAAVLSPSLSREALPGAGAWIAISFALFAAGGAAVALSSARFTAPAAGAAGLALAVAIVRIALAPPLIDLGNVVNLAPEVGRDLATLAPAGAEVGVGRKGADYIMYYARRPVIPLERPGPTVRFLEEKPGRFLVLKSREFKELESRLDGAEVVRRWGDDARGYVLVQRAAGRAGPS